MYKDKDRQRQAQRERTRRYRVRAKGVTSEGITQGVTRLGSHVTVTPEGLKAQVPANYGQPNCECRHCQQVKTNNITFKRKHYLNHGQYKTVNELADNEFNRVSLPGDEDYDGVCLNPKYDSHRRSLQAQA